MKKFDKDAWSILRSSRDLIVQRWHTALGLKHPEFSGVEFEPNGKIYKVMQETVEELASFLECDSVTDPMVPILNMEEASNICIASRSVVHSILLSSVGWPDAYHCLHLLDLEIHRELNQNHISPYIISAATGYLSVVASRVALLQIDTHQKKEQVLEKHLALKQATTQYISCASHHLRTPLTVVIGLAELLSEETYGALNDKQKAVITQIEQAARTSIESTDNLLDILSLAEGNLKTAQRIRNISDVITDLIPVFKLKASQKNISVDIATPKYIPDVITDANLIRHILFTLGSTLIRSMSKNGQFNLSARLLDHNRIEFTLMGNQIDHLPSVSNTVNDTGGKTVQEDTTSYGEWNQSIAISERFAEMLQGSIEYNTCNNEKLKFVITVPFTLPDDSSWSN